MATLETIESKIDQLIGLVQPEERTIVIGPRDPVEWRLSDTVNFRGASSYTIEKITSTHVPGGVTIDYVVPTNCVFMIPPGASMRVMWQTSVSSSFTVRYEIYDSSRSNLVQTNTVSITSDGTDTSVTHSIDLSNKTGLALMRVNIVITPMSAVPMVSIPLGFIFYIRMMMRYRNRTVAREMQDDLAVQLSRLQDRLDVICEQTSTPRDQSINLLHSPGWSLSGSGATINSGMESVVVIRTTREATTVVLTRVNNITIQKYSAIRLTFLTNRGFTCEIGIVFLGLPSGTLYPSITSSFTATTQRTSKTIDIPCQYYDIAVTGINIMLTLPAQGEIGDLRTLTFYEIDEIYPFLSLSDEIRNNSSGGGGGGGSTTINQPVFNQLMANVPNNIKDLYKGSGAITQDRFNVLMEDVPTTIKDEYKAMIMGSTSFRQDEFNKLMFDLPDAIKRLFRTGAMTSSTFHSYMLSVPESTKDLYKGVVNQLTEEAFREYIGNLPSQTYRLFQSDVINQSTFNARMLGVPDSTKDLYKAGTIEITQDRFTDLITNVPDNVKDTYKSTYTLTQGAFNGLMAGVSESIKGTYKAIPFSLTQDMFNTLMDGVSTSIKDTYKASGSFSISQSVFDGLMLGVPVSTKDMYKASTLSIDQTTFNGLMLAVPDTTKELYQSSYMVTQNAFNGLMQGVSDSIKATYRSIPFSLTQDMFNGFMVNVPDSTKDQYKAGDIELSQGRFDSLIEGVPASIKAMYQSSITQDMFNGLMDGVRDNIKDSYKGVYVLPSQVELMANRFIAMTTESNQLIAGVLDLQPWLISGTMVRASEGLISVRNTVINGLLVREEIFYYRTLASYNMDVVDGRISDTPNNFDTMRILEHSYDSNGNFTQTTSTIMVR